MQSFDLLEMEGEPFIFLILDITHARKQKYIT